MPDLVLPITTLAALANGVIFGALTLRVVAHRRRKRVVHGDADDPVLRNKIRGQGNAAEQMPLALIVMALTEAQGGSGWVLAMLAVLFTVGRALHGAYFAIHGLTWRLRFWGMLSTLVAQAGLLALLALLAVTAL